MGGGTSKESCRNAGYYREAITVGEEDDGFKIVDLHGSGVFTFFLGAMLGAFLTAAFILSCRRLGIGCKRSRKPRDNTAARYQPGVPEQSAMQIYHAPPALGFLPPEPPIFLAPTNGTTRSSPFYRSPTIFEDITNFAHEDTSGLRGRQEQRQTNTIRRHIDEPTGDRGNQHIQRARGEEQATIRGEENHRVPHEHHANGTVMA